MTAVPFCSEAGKTAFPVRAVIQWFNLTDSRQRDLVYQLADMLLREMRDREAPPMSRDTPYGPLHPLAQAILDTFGMDLAQALAYHLQQNFRRSRQFEGDLARVENNIKRSLPFVDFYAKVQLMTYLERQWSRDHAHLIFMP